MQMDQLVSTIDKLFLIYMILSIFNLYVYIMYGKVNQQNGCNYIFTFRLFAGLFCLKNCDCLFMFKW